MPLVARAEEPYQMPDEIREPPKLPATMASAARPIALHDAIALAVRQNLGIQLSREQSAAAEVGTGVPYGRFEPILTAFYSHGDADTPPPISLQQEGIPTMLLNIVSDTWNIGVNQRLQTGTLLALNFTNGRSLSSPADPMTSPLFYNSGLALSLTQPLLKGFAFSLDVPRADILRARFASERAKEDVRTAMIATVHQTENAYWDLVQALKTYEVQLSTLELAQQQLALTQKQIDAGILPPSDLISAEGTLSQRRLALVQVETTVGQAGDRLRRVLNLPREDWLRALLPIDPPRFSEDHVALEHAQAIALRKRPEIAQRKLDVSRADLDVRVAKTDRLPQLDAQFSYGMVGQTAGYSSTLDQLFAADVPAWSATLNFSWTPLMKAARAQLAVLENNRDAAHTQLDQLELDLYFELRDDLRTLDTSAREVRAAAKFRDLATRALDAEQRKFLNGTSNNIFVAQRQADLAQARLAELQAVISHQKAETALAAAMGVLLEDRGIRLDVTRTEARRSD